MAHYQSASPLLEIFIDHSAWK